MQQSRKSSFVVPDVTASALGLRDQRLATPNGAFCKVLAQIEKWIIMRNNLERRKNVFWLTEFCVSVLILLAPLLWAWDEVEAVVVGMWGKGAIDLSRERQEGGARGKECPLNTSPVTCALQTGLTPENFLHFPKFNHRLATGHVELFQSSKSM